MLKILFVCHGNICRSPMAEYIFRHMVREKGLSDLFHVGSAAVSSEEQGNPIYGPAARELAAHGIAFGRHRARKLSKDEYRQWDMFVGMDHSNKVRMLSIFGGDPEHKVSLLMEAAGSPGDVDDPWYSGDFTAAWKDISEGCACLLEQLCRTRLKNSGSETSGGKAPL